MIPSLISAGTARLPPAQFGAGSGVLNMGRQLGAVIGVAALIAILSGTTASARGGAGPSSPSRPTGTEPSWR